VDLQGLAFVAGVLAAFAVVISWQERP